MKHVPLSELKNLLAEVDARVTKSRYSLPETALQYILKMIQPPALAERYIQFYNKHPYFTEVCAGAKHHHWWLGGLSTHVKEMIGFCFDVMDLYPGDFHSFTKTDVIIACFLHDFAKIWSYVPITPEDREKDPKKFLPQQVFKYSDGKEFDRISEEMRTMLELSAFGITPTINQLSAVEFAEGGWADSNFGFGGTTRTGDTAFARNPLAVMIHMADLFSSQLLGASLKSGNTEVPIAQDLG